MVSLNSPYSVGVNVFSSCVSLRWPAMDWQHVWGVSRPMISGDRQRLPPEPYIG